MSKIILTIFLVFSILYLGIRLIIYDPIKIQLSYFASSLIVIALLLSILTFFKSGYNLSTRINILLVGLESCLFVVYSHFQPLCEPCLICDDCPPCLSSLQIFVIFFGLFIFLIRVLSKIWWNR